MNNINEVLNERAVKASAPVWLFDDSGRVWSLEEAREYITDRITINDAGCWIWDGPKTKDGYGQIGDTSLLKTFGIKGAHRLSYYAHTGHKPEGRAEPVLHACDVRACCNPDHLDAGTHAENMRQMAERGRASRGENHPNAVLTEVDVRAIRKAYSEGATNGELARRYNYSVGSMSKIINRHSWSHVD